MMDSRPGGDGHQDATADLAKRLDPDDTLRQAEQLAGFIDNPLVRLLLSLSAKKPRDLRQQAQELGKTTDRMRQLLNTLPDIVTTLAPLGWCVTGTSSPTDSYAEAAALAARGDTKAAEDLLVETWNQPGRLRTASARVKTLYAADDERLHHRWRHLDQALRCHDAELYAGSIALLLSLLEGVVRDVTDNRHTPYRRGEADLLTDDTTLAGYREGLPVLVRLLGAKQDATAATGELRRNGVLHGRELAFDTRANSTKVFVALAAFIEWAQPIAVTRLRAEQALREARYAGSDEVGQDGRRLDRRGFADVKGRLKRTLTYQWGRRQHGRPYAAQVRELDADLATSPGLHLLLEHDADVFWAWERTTAGWVFGAAGADGQQVGWLYSGPEAPTGPPSRGEGWKHIATDTSHKDW